MSGRGLVQRPLADLYFNEGHQAGRAELLHVVVDGATLRKYCRALEDFLDWAGTWSEAAIDGQLAEYFSFLCFTKQVKAHVAGTTLAAVLHFMPAFKGKFAAAARALRAFHALVRSKERPPFSRRTVGALVRAMLLAGEREAAFMTLCIFAFFGRGGEWSILRLEDVATGRGRVTVTFGKAERGEKAKTGFDQGAEVREPAAVEWMTARKRAWTAAGKDGSDRFFTLTPQEYRTIFKNTCAVLGLPEDTPHVLRHTAATELFATGSVDIAGLKLAGRWARESSVKRYTKPHLILVHEAIVSAEVLRLGDQFWAAPMGFIGQ